MAGVTHLQEFHSDTDMAGQTELKVHKLYIARALPVRLYVTPSYYTIAWPGQIRFSELEAEAIDSLSEVLFASGPRRPLAVPYLREAAKVSFILSGDEPQLLTFKLQDRVQYRHYKQLLAYPGSISFARYDVGEASDTLRRYTFTAENPDFFTKEESELAIQLPKSQLLPSAALRWVASHHNSASKHAGERDYSETLAEIQQLID